MIIGDVKGYGICNVTKKKIEKEDFLSELQKVDSNIKAEILEVLESQGYVYGLKKKKVLKAVYLFDNKQEENKKVLVFNKSICSEEIKDIIKEFENVLITELKGKVVIEEFSKVIWNDIEILPRNIRNGKFSMLAFSLCFFLGFLFGIGTDNLLIGLSLSLLFGLCFGEKVDKKDVEVKTRKDEK